MTKTKIALKILNGLLANSEIAKELIKGEVQKIKFLEKKGVAPKHIKKHNNGEVTQAWFVSVAFQFADKFIEEAKQQDKVINKINLPLIVKQVKKAEKIAAKKSK